MIFLFNSIKQLASSKFFRKQHSIPDEANIKIAFIFPKPILINPSFLKKCSLFFLGQRPHHLRVLPHLCSIEESPSQKAWTWVAAVTSFRWGWRANFGSLDQTGSTTLKLTVLTLSLLALSIEIISALHCSALKLTVPQYLLWSIEINSLHALCMSTEIICSAITPVQCH